MTLSSGTLAQRLDAINEFDREPVSEDHLQGPGNFIGLYAGEHVAGTEFVIGPLFVAHGVTAIDLVLGLLVGNLLAVLSWTCLCAPIATRTRLNLNWKLRKIAGPNLLFVYNIVNALMFCFLAGAMISVAATAVGITRANTVESNLAILPSLDSHSSSVRQLKDSWVAGCCALVVASDHGPRAPICLPVSCRSTDY